MILGPRVRAQLFKEGAPADFVLIGATTREPDELDPAILSRAAADVLSAVDAGCKIRRSLRPRKAARRAPSEAVAELIASYTIEGERPCRSLADALRQALYCTRRNAEKTNSGAIVADDVLAVVQSGRMLQHTPVAGAARARSENLRSRRLHYLGSSIEIEAIVFHAAQRARGRAFQRDGRNMAKDSVFNAAEVLRALAGIDLADYDLHINIIGGGNIDGPSAGLAIFLALYSASPGRRCRKISP